MRLSLVLCLFVFLYTSSSLSSVHADNKTVIFLPVEATTYALPVPHQKLPINSYVEVKVDGEPVQSTISYDHLWPDRQSVRTLNIRFNKAPLSFSKLSLTWFEANSTISANTSLDTSAVLIFPTKTWLREAFMLTSNEATNDDWYRAPQILRAEYLANEQLLTKDGYPPEVASQWLYDRGQAFYQLYFSNLEEERKSQADGFVAFYKQHVNEYGFFSLAKDKDVKYLMGRSLVYDYFLNPGSDARSVLARMFKASLSWRDQYNGRGFWTERHAAAALNIAVSYWEVTGNKDAKERVNRLISGLTQMTMNPEFGWQQAGCPQHTFKSHEGWGDNSPACSPWMMALVTDSLWRYYQLTQYEQASNLMRLFADFVTNKGTYVANEGKIKGHIIPKYIVSLHNPKQEELDPWSDREHMCDVATMVGRGVYLKRLSGQKHERSLHLFSQLAQQCKAMSLATIEKYKYVNIDYLRSKPPRKFNWQYSTTDDLPWLLEKLNTTKGKEEVK
ncbi:hypothetical protein tloyanaT_01130 [Thalassotalea loyana]|uniref:Uncharacterized protein n=1 Tax=Thalassotalea loyana TaxID=280483 RepID=A0ABQ6H6U8_9GAMM|nr:hypothetical protein [Thalassotalea loyana]GLX83861.1 hypothetical protein tloyanaT_01130 [Thalassotalea loyana]